MLLFIQQIPGPVFLLIYLVVAIVAIYFGAKASDKTGTQVLPDINALRPYETAYLRGGYVVLIQTIIYSLWKQELLKQTEDGSNKYVAVKNATSSDPMERLILDIAKEPLGYTAFLGREVKSKIAELFQKSLQKLEGMQLIYSDFEIQRRKSIRNKVLLFLVALGGIKIYMGLSNDKPVLFLVFMVIIAVLVTFKFISVNLAGATKLGKQYLKSLEDKYNWARNSESYQEQPGYSMLDMALMTGAIYGMSSMMDAPFHQEMNSTTGTETSDFSSSCSGSSCSGSSCSGSSCSGSGCGGCGGGD